MKAIVIFDIDGVIRDVSRSYRRAIADTVEHFSDRACRPSMEDIDNLKAEGIWNNDWECSQELLYRYFESQGKSRKQINLDYEQIVSFFQSRYRGTNAECWDGYITSEPLLVTKDYFQQLSDAGIGWGFFSGATRASAEYVLKGRLGLDEPMVVAMEDAPSKPNPEGLFKSVQFIEARHSQSNSAPVYYLGDTIADIKTIARAREIEPSREWVAIGILPPHVLAQTELKWSYQQSLERAGASKVFSRVTKFRL